MHFHPSLPCDHLGIHGLGFEPRGNDILSHSSVKGLTGEDVEVGVPCLVAKVGRDVAGLYELDEGVARLVAFSKMLNEGPAVGLHVDALDQVVCEEFDDSGIGNGQLVTAPGIYHTMKTPVLKHILPAAKTFEDIVLGKFGLG